jgi:hypothetical protein
LSKRCERATLTCLSFTVLLGALFHFLCACLRLPHFTGFQMCSNLQQQWIETVRAAAGAASAAEDECRFLLHETRAMLPQCINNVRH